MLKPLIDAIKIIKDMCSSPYNNSGGKRVIKRNMRIRKIDASFDIED